MAEQGSLLIPHLVFQVMRIWVLAEWSGAPVAVQGPSRWYLRTEGSLTTLAEQIQRDLEHSHQLELVDANEKSAA